MKSPPKNATSSRVGPHCKFTDPSLRVGTQEGTEEANCNFLAEGRSSRISASHERAANRRREKKGMGPNCVEFRLRAGYPDVAPSRLRESAITTSPTALARETWPFRTLSLPENATMGPNLRIEAHGEIEEGPRPGYLPPAAGKQTERGERGKRGRIAVNLLSGLAGAPPIHRVFTSCLRQHRRRFRHEGNRYFLKSRCPRTQQQNRT